MFKNSPINYLNTMGFLVFYSGLLLVFFVEFKLIYLVFFVFNFFWFGLSSSLFYHRAVTHKAAELHPVMEVIFLLGGTISLSGGPISWAAVHRCHHAIPDTKDDPHTPKDGRFWAYMGWVTHTDFGLVNSLKEKYCKDLLQNKLYILFERKFMLFLPTTMYVLMLYYFFGMGAVVWGFLIAGLLSYNFHWMLIASFCHSSKLGYRRFNTKYESRNVPWLSLYSFGESLHNNHHKYPNNFKLNSGRWEFDISFFSVQVLEKMGLAKNISVVDFNKKNGSS